MAPEMAVGYVVGLIPSATAGGLHYLSAKKRSSRPEFVHIQNNLSRVGLYWSDSDSDIRPLREGSYERDRQRSLNSLLTFSLICLALSWVGFFFQILIWVSLQKLAVSRLEKFLFSSEISKRAVSDQDLSLVIKEYESRRGHPFEFSDRS